MSRGQVMLLRLATAVVSLSGLVFFVMKYFMKTDDPFSVVNHPLQPYFLDAHVLAAPFLVFSIGGYAVSHVWPQFRSGTKQGRRTGFSVMMIILPMVVTGYLLQVATGENLLSWTAIVHIAVGALFLLGFIFHLSVTRKHRAQPASSA